MIPLIFEEAVSRNPGITFLAITEENQSNGVSGRDRMSELPQLADPHPNFPSFSSAVSVRHEKSRGRYCVASRRIEVSAGSNAEKPGIVVVNPK